jgi:KaiC/GvpD/RAD55 family RecA-like ATPase
LNGVVNLTNISIALTSAARKLAVSAEKSSKRLCVDIVSDVLLQHGPVTTRKWLSELLTQMHKVGFTTIAVLDPRMHPSDQLYAILSMFDGEVNVREAETEKGVARFLKAKRMSDAKFLGEEMRLS